MSNRFTAALRVLRTVILLGMAACGDDVTGDLDSGALSDAHITDGGARPDGPNFDAGSDPSDAGASDAAFAETGPDAVMTDLITEIRVTPPTTTLARGDEVALTAQAFNDRGEEVAATITWSSDDSTIVTVDASGRAIAAGAGTGIVRATSGDASGSAEIVVEPLDDYMKNYIEALFLGTGPFTPSDGAAACVTFPGRWAAYPRGTTVTIVASTTLDEGSDGVDTVALLRAAAVDVEVATLGAVRAVLTTTTDADPIPLANQATVTDHPDPISTGCAFDRGCVHSEFSDGDFTVIESNRIVLRESIQPADAYVHDTIGHGLMGMCHIDQAAIGGTSLSLMSGGPGAFTGDIADGLSPLDVAASRAVYATSLEPGARREDFVALELILP